MFMTDKQLLHTTQVLVNVYAPLILRDLGLKEDDSIISRITVSDETGPTVPLGMCSIKILSTPFSTDVTYVKESATVVIYPLTMFSYVNGKGEYKLAPKFTKLFKKQIRRNILETLAHELRHYWQYVSGEYDTHEVHHRGHSLMPYNLRWCEKDANKYAHTFTSVTKLI